MDVGERFLQDVKEACVDIADTVVAGCQAVQRAWDNLDPGLKQWIVNGVSLAVGFIPLVGPLLSCVIDGTFVDMFSAIMKGDWAMVGMCALAFVPGVGGLGKLGKFASHADDVSRAVKAAGKSKRIAIIGEDMKGRVLPFAKRLESKGLKVETFTPSKGLSMNQALEENAQWVRNLKKEGVAIADIGPSPARPMFPEPSSPFYGVERQEVKGYWNLLEIWRP